MLRSTMFVCKWFEDVFRAGIGHSGILYIFMVLQLWLLDDLMDLVFGVGDRHFVAIYDELGRMSVIGEEQL